MEPVYVVNEWYTKNVLNQHQAITWKKIGTHVINNNYCLRKTKFKKLNNNCWEMLLEWFRIVIMKDIILDYIEQ